jgi:hypothetical protein
MQQGVLLYAPVTCAEALGIVSLSHPIGAGANQEHRSIVCVVQNAICKMYLSSHPDVYKHVGFSCLFLYAFRC